jgi:hypothetical protein
MPATHILPATPLGTFSLLFSCFLYVFTHSVCNHASNHACVLAWAGRESIARQDVQTCKEAHTDGLCGEGGRLIRNGRLHADEGGRAGGGRPLQGPCCSADQRPSGDFPPSPLNPTPHTPLGTPFCIMLHLCCYTAVLLLLLLLRCCCTACLTVPHGGLPCSCLRNKRQKET